MKEGHEGRKEVKEVREGSEGRKEVKEVNTLKPRGRSLLRIVV